jgi:hypothetical protein
VGARPVADLFVSYAREDRARVVDLIGLLEGQQWSVFWDRDIPPGGTWRSHIGRELERARCVVVAWSEHSVRSDWVIDEAEDAKERGILVPVLLDAVRPPHGFRGIQAADLSGWRKGRNSFEAAALLAVVTKVLGDASPTAEDTPGDRSQGAEGDGASPGPADVTDVRWPPGLRTKPFVLGGLAVAAVVGAGTFLAWPVPPAGRPGSAPGLEASTKPHVDVAKSGPGGSGEQMAALPSPKAPVSKPALKTEAVDSPGLIRVVAIEAGSVGRDTEACNKSDVLASLVTTLNRLIEHNLVFAHAKSLGINGSFGIDTWIVKKELRLNEDSSNITSVENNNLPTMTYLGDQINKMREMCKILFRYEDINSNDYYSVIENILNGAMVASNLKMQGSVGATVRLSLM